MDMGSLSSGDRAFVGCVPMRLQYGVNESDSWWHFARGPNRERIWTRLRELDVRIVRMFVFDKHAPDPVREWPLLRDYIQAALNLGATPFLTFAKFRRPFDDPRAVRWFTEQCSELVWSCTQEWGGAAVKDWYWCVWNEPNNDWIGGGINFEQYRKVYDAVARGIVAPLKPWLHGETARIGGPSVEGFTAFWFDWIWRLLNEVDPSLVGFVNWHYYAEWRDAGEADAAADPRTMERLIMAQAPQFGIRAAQVARLLHGRRLPNVCGEWNAHSHYLPAVRARFNQSVFGAVYGAAALIHFMRGGVDAEMVWTGTDDACGYGMLDPEATPTPLYHAKRMCARYVRYGDGIRFPLSGKTRPGWDAVVSHKSDGGRSAFVVHTSDGFGTLPLSDLDPEFARGATLIRLDGADHGQPRIDCAGRRAHLEFPGYGVAVVTSEPAAG
jgi:hypothetical protein